MKSPYLSKDGLIKKLVEIELYPNKLIEGAFEEAYNTHFLQRRDDGTPYLEQHIYPVTLSVVEFLKDIKKMEVRKDVVAAALLHDTLEDSLSIYDEEFIEAFGHGVYNLVKPLSKPKKRGYSPKRIGFREELRLDIKKVNEWPYISKVIKIHDRINNLSCCSITITKELRKKYIKQLIETKILYLPVSKEISRHLYDELSKKTEEFSEFLKNAGYVTRQ